MRCRHGDLAVIVGGGIPQNLGRMVRVLRRCDAFAWAITGADWEVELLQTATTTRFSVFSDQPPGEVCLCKDSILRPIRDGEGADETLAWANKPAEVPA